MIPVKSSKMVVHFCVVFLATDCIEANVACRSRWALVYQCERLGSGDCVSADTGGGEQRCTCCCPLLLGWQVSFVAWEGTSVCFIQRAVEKQKGSTVESSL